MPREASRSPSDPRPTPSLTPWEGTTEFISQTPSNHRDQLSVKAGQVQIQLARALTHIDQMHHVVAGMVGRRRSTRTRWLSRALAAGSPAMGKRRLRDGTKPPTNQEGVNYIN